MDSYKKHIKILILDDDVTFVNNLSNMLGDLGYSASVSFSPLEAEILIRQQPFHIVFVDCLMPEFDGYSFAKQIEKDFGSSIKILLMSGVFNTQDINYMEHKNILSMIKKPIDQVTLQKEIESAINSIIRPPQEHYLTSLLCGPISLGGGIYKEFNNVRYLNEGCVSLLFFYLLYSNSESILSLSDEKYSIEIGFSSGNVVHFSEHDRSRVISYFSQKNILKEEDLESFLTENGIENLYALIAHGLVSPHHYIQYVKDGVKWGIEYFSKKTCVQVQLKQNTLFEDADIEQDVEVSLNSVQFVKSMAQFMNSEISIHFLKDMMNSLKEYQLNVDDSRRKALRKYVIPSFKLVYDQIDDLKSSASLNDLFNMYPNEQNKICRIVFWLLSQRIITLKQDPRVQLSQVYAQRYQYLYKIIKNMDLVQVFEFLGCVNASDYNHIKKIFSIYTEQNHVDLFSQYSMEVQQWVGQCHQTVINAYNTLGNNQKMKNYHRKRQMKEAQDVIEVESLKKDVQMFVQNTKYEEALKLIQKIREQENITTDVRSEIFLWEAVIEIERSAFSLSGKRLTSLFEQVQSAVYQSKVPIYIYYYVSGLMEICNENDERAQFFFQKALKENSNFNLAKIKQLTLQNKMGKTKFVNLGKLMEKKKKPA